MESKSAAAAAAGSGSGQSMIYDFYQNYMMNTDYSMAVKSSIDWLVDAIQVRPLVPSTNNNFKVSSYNYSHVFGFEKKFENVEYVYEKKRWMERNWASSFAIAAVYMLLIVLGKWYMSSRPRYELRTPLVLWNLGLAIFSILGALRAWPEFIYSIFDRGIVTSICSNDYGFGIPGFWAYMFIMSKLPELIDTLFIVLRKQELIFLHYYHHATVLIYCWYSYSSFAASGRWFMNMNYLVHAVMYSYFALKAMRINVSKKVSLLITSGQIAQMVFGCYVNYVAYETKKSGKRCDITDDNIKYSFLMYSSYFVLFAHFFANSYIIGKKAKKIAADNAAKLASSNGHAATNGSLKKTPAHIVDKNNNSVANKKSN